MENQQIKLSLDQTLEVVCEKCGNLFFDEVLHIRKISGILTGTGNSSYMPIPLFACTKCKHVNKEFLPVELRDLFDKS